MERERPPSPAVPGITTVGVIGLGNIGRGVAMSAARGENLQVLVWDQLDAARKAFANTSNTTVATPGEMAQRAAVILFVVPSTTEILSCLRGRDGIFNHAKQGLVIYDLTTSDPTKTRAVAKKAAKHGIIYLDAGTSGGPYKADKGRLLTMVGGDRDAFERTRHVLKDICEHVFFVGPSGAGHTLKLLHNIVCHATTLATAEAGHMAERAGISLKDMIDVFNVSNARSYASEFRFPQHIISKTWDGRSRIFNLHKDIAMGVALGKRLGADTTFSRATLQILNLAMAHGMSEDDHTLLYRDFDKFRRKTTRRVATAMKSRPRKSKRAKAKSSGGTRHQKG
jgi:3-hydroxyisobutyrate dehydrogenase